MKSVLLLASFFFLTPILDARNVSCSELMATPTAAIPANLTGRISEDLQSIILLGRLNATPVTIDLHGTLTDVKDLSEQLKSKANVTGWDHIRNHATSGDMGSIFINFSDSHNLFDILSNDIPDGTARLSYVRP